MMNQHFPVKFIPALFGVWLSIPGIMTAQTTYTVKNAHSHNDYLQKTPFFDANSKGFESIEADVYPVNGKLCVAHSKKEINPGRTLEQLYILPALQVLRADRKRSFSLLIDIKQDYKTSMQLLIRELEPLSEFLNANRLRIMISGDRPLPTEFDQYPAYIQFDDDQSRVSNAAQWKRVGLVSLRFSNFTKWKGQGAIPAEDAEKLKWTIDSVHRAGKRIRFWDAPDNRVSWQTQVDLSADLIGTDHVQELAVFFEKLKVLR